uniref:Uncharacterized protein n=1 Tax=Anopheles atroparvus TaxID=41427 RepID=A0A182JD54_ANOAO
MMHTIVLIQIIRLPGKLPIDLSNGRVMGMLIDGSLATLRSSPIGAAHRRAPHICTHRPTIGTVFKVVIPRWHAKLMCEEYFLTSELRPVVAVRRLHQTLERVPKVADLRERLEEILQLVVANEKSGKQERWDDRGWHDERAHFDREEAAGDEAVNLRQPSEQSADAPEHSYPINFIGLAAEIVHYQLERRDARYHPWEVGDEFREVVR